MADVLIIDDQDRTSDLLRRMFPEHRLRGPARSWTEAEALLARLKGRLDCVLLDVHFDVPKEQLLGPTSTDAEVERSRRTQGLLILRAIRSQYPDLPAIVMTSRDGVSFENEDLARDEEYTYFLDDDQIDARAIGSQIAAFAAARTAPVSEGPIYWGPTIAVHRIRQRLAVLSRGRLPVVLLGPTGTGKSLLARHFVHQRTGRTGRFVAVDLATTPPDLMAAQLFGSVRGAYTGSVGDQIGAFEAAHGGTLFLDEIGNLSADAQRMLLTVLEQGTVTRVGDLKERAVDVKLVAATCEDLALRVVEGTFRADLYMRLNPTAAITLPALKDRRLDVGALLSHALSLALRRPGTKDMVQEVREAAGLGVGPTRVHAGGGIPEPEPDVLVILWPERSMRLLRTYDWPGNLREFAMVVENATLFALAEASLATGGGRVDVVQVRPKVVRDLLRISDVEVGGDRRIAVELRQHDTLNKVAQDCERQYFRHLWFEHDGDFAAMAQVLLGTRDDARKVQLRFNQLGLKVKDLRGERDA
jgi:DNA-binding NtrC family response regulator